MKNTLKEIKNSLAFNKQITLTSDNALTHISVGYLVAYSVKQIAFEDLNANDLKTTKRNNYMLVALARNGMCIVCDCELTSNMCNSIALRQAQGDKTLVRENATKDLFYIA